MPQIHLAHWTRMKGFKGLEVTGIWNHWKLAVYGKRLQHHIFLNNEPFTSERVQVFKFQSCPDPFVP